MFKMGKSVGVVSLTLKNFDLDSTDVDFMLPDFNIFSIRLILLSFHYWLKFFPIRVDLRNTIRPKNTRLVGISAEIIE